MGLFDEVAGGLLKSVLSGQGGQGGLLEIIMNQLKDSESEDFPGWLKSSKSRIRGRNVFMDR